MNWGSAASIAGVPGSHKRPWRLLFADPSSPCPFPPGQEHRLYLKEPALIKCSEFLFFLSSGPARRCSPERQYRWGVVFWVDLQSFCHCNLHLQWHDLKTTFIGVCYLLLPPAPCFPRSSGYRTCKWPTPPFCPDRRSQRRDGVSLASSNGSTNKRTNS